MSETNIYQQIWESDENQFSVSTRTSSGEWEDETADILLDEQVKASGQREIDLATRPLFYKVNEDKLFDETRTYSSFIKLLDNYAIRSLDPEFTPEEEEHEQLDFISLILSTKPIQLARNYINEELGENLSEQQFRIKLQRIWFEHYTNYYKGKSTHFASGFEHVFVGEGKYNIRSGDKRETLGTISGYHSWVKFYLDEKNQRVNFLGYKYDLRGNEGPNNPNVVTLQMNQNVTDMGGNVIAKLFKKKGGFFVGPSPECEIAIATVAYYESIYGKIRDKRRITINDATYDLVLYRSTNPNGSRGEFIRSFFPIFLSKDGTKEPDMDRPVVVPVDDIIKNDGAVIIVAALPNPEGSDEGGSEWVELKNVTSEAIDLTGWEMADKLGRPQLLSGILQPLEVKRFPITRLTQSSMQLSNKSGLITVRDRSSNQIATVKYSRARSGHIFQFN
ncbi:MULTISPECIES: lamin tail domain-containing protein [Moorena]|uniref:Endoribonuclease XendoU n=1 Tax=Moorena producens 3L TaxID=489825 RepID=F4XS02_9CYAN|nr:MULTISPECIES: lamin tail domain-containing protein [Moorena]NEQ13915.1 endoribonuclease [Moorena sp. SIO3E2]EGJ32594.1 endoribonuclease XendoU [Moorena producens 3L]NEP70255.1 endoribonuclease [Moorena sp. SIO3A5]NEQ04918.1 endoribonuclease [Moorena sp. SIO4E2]NER87586.1 endoribonuclease [Moorena sp. SIO3A2]